ncbi:MAG: hypothetical protein K9N49_00595 [Candidatus Marinimicrobia bacterium]|nr:hypothetical protein [Candidatus Neomarinimicrobiota bacterium]
MKRGRLGIDWVPLRHIPPPSIEYLPLLPVDMPDQELPGGILPLPGLELPSLLDVWRGIRQHVLEIDGPAIMALIIPRRDTALEFRQHDLANVRIQRLGRLDLPLMPLNHRFVFRHQEPLKRTNDAIPFHLLGPSIGHLTLLIFNTATLPADADPRNPKPA